MIFENHIEYIQTTLENPDNFSYPELYFYDKRYCIWESRYNSLSQDTRFFKNLVVIEELVRECSNKEQLLLKCDLKDIPIEAIRFVCCYFWFTPTRFFSENWKVLPQLNHMHIPLVISKEEFNTWNIVKNIYKETIKFGLPMLEVQDFINLFLK